MRCTFRGAHWARGVALVTLVLYPAGRTHGLECRSTRLDCSDVTLHTASCLCSVACVAHGLVCESIPEKIPATNHTWTGPWLDGPGVFVVLHFSHISS